MTPLKVLVYIISCVSVMSLAACDDDSPQKNYQNNSSATEDTSSAGNQENSPGYQPSFGSSRKADCWSAKNAKNQAAIAYSNMENAASNGDRPTFIQNKHYYDDEISRMKDADPNNECN